MNIRTLYGLLLIMQTVALSYLFIWGPRGWRESMQLQNTIAYTQHTVDEKKQLVAQLQEEEESWHCNSFNKERVAREQLQMARASDTVFYR